MGGSSSRESRRQTTVVRQQQQQQQRSQASPPPAMPHHLQQQFPHPPPAAQAAYNSSASAQRPAGIQEAEKIKFLATIDANSVHYEPNCQLLTFRITSQVPTTTYYEVHTAVRETIRNGQVIYTPNKPKPAPEVVPLLGPQEDTEIAVQIDLTNVEPQEMKYNKAYPKQRPCVIVLKYRDENGQEHSEHTSVDLALDARRAVIGQIIHTKGSCYSVECLFGADHEEVTVGAVMPESGGGNGGTSPAAGVTTDGDDDGLCVICLTNDKDTAVLPCRHLCLCKECAEQLMKHTPKCPVCRGPISQLLHMPKSS